MNIKALIIDDERKATIILKKKIQRLFDNVEVVGMSQSPDESIELIEKLKPDLIFLDIVMPRMSGFDLLRKIEDPSFAVIFVTAFDNYAIEAINHCALGYLVKPVEDDLLKKSIVKAIKSIQEKNALEKNRQLLEYLNVHGAQKKKIVVPVTEGLEFINIEEIIHCEGKDGYTKLHLDNDSSILSSRSIGYFTKLLKEKNFYLVHKSHLVNLNYVLKYLNEGFLLLTKGGKIPVSRLKRTNFLKTIKDF